MHPLYISGIAIATASGLGAEQTFSALRERRSGLRPNDFESFPHPTWIGRVAAVEASEISGPLAEFDCRNNRMAHLALQQDGFRDAVAGARDRYGAKRIATLIGTSTSGILETELAYQRGAGRDTALRSRHYDGTHSLFSVTGFVRRALHLDGPAATVSNACASSAKVFAQAHRLIEADICDAAVVGGVDSLCLTTLHGFSSLELLSQSPCRPWDAGRDGISIGEAGGFVLLERTRQADSPGRPDEGVALLGYGESSDAYHMSSPHPDGAGAVLAMSAALERAGVHAADVDYINLHGTATPANDRAEDTAVHAVFGDATPASSTKGWTGHTLGAAGIVEAIVSILCLRRGFLPGTLNTRERDTAMRSRVVLENEERPLHRVLSNSFGFGGNNCSLLFGRIN
jgi:3-oxoacyl-[acyl-carrier-protein] synthase-1